MPAFGIGVDFSTHRVHLTKVARDKLVSERVVRIDQISGPDRMRALGLALHEMHNGEPGGLVVIEKPYLGKFNPQTLMHLSFVAGNVEGAAYLEELAVQFMAASEWRSLVGIKLGPKTARVDLKAAAMWMYRVQFQAEASDDNVAESALIALAAARNQPMQALIRDRPRPRRNPRGRAYLRQQIDEDVTA